MSLQQPCGIHAKPATSGYLPQPMEPKRIAILGVGDRGRLFAGLLREMGERARLVAVADPGRKHRNAVVKEHEVPSEMIFPDWQTFCVKPPPCDAVIIATPDRQHVGPAVACLNHGLDLLLEKPMGVSLKECQAINAAQHNSGRIVGVCHSLRYHHAFRKVRDLIKDGAIGRVMTVDLLEQVEIKHHAHSFVRGNWGNQSRSTFMLLAKSCHDLDYLSYLIDRPCLAVNSFGHLSYFRPENAPAGATDRCTDGCPHEPTCTFSAIKQYVDTHRDKWPANVTGAQHSREAQLEFLRTGPYGRCVWKCDNDAVDHQVVAMQFADDITATFTMTAFTAAGGRRLRVHGTLGELYFDEETITIRAFASPETQTITPTQEQGGHGGGDRRVLADWLTALHTRDESLILANVAESLKTHTIAFAAEQSRREKRIVNLEEMSPMTNSN
jgi:predicted dehydrogenase